MAEYSSNPVKIIDVAADSPSPNRVPSPNSAPPPHTAVGRMRGAAVAIGNFDGAHLGHMRLIATLTRSAARLGLRALAYTFGDHPQNVLPGSGGVKLLTSAEQKSELLSKTAVDLIYIERFDREFASLSPEEFIRQKMARQFNARLIVVGSGFRFGSRASGTVETFRALGQSCGYAVEEVPPYAVGIITGGGARESITVSSSAIREYIRTGRVDMAARLLGRLYSLSGVAVDGVDPPACAVTPACAAPSANGCMPPAYNRKPPVDNVRQPVYIICRTNRGYKPSAVLLPDARTAVPRPGKYAAAVKTGGYFYKAVAEVYGPDADNGGPFACRGGCRIEIFLKDNDMDLHGAQIEIFFVKTI